MEQLNIYNYEAFYLDFLDGNLNQEDVAQLFRFLDENPSLKIEEENFDEIINFNERLDDSFKNELKQVDFELDEITQFTINSFLIAQFEKQLSANKEKEIEEFLVEHPNFKKEQQQINSTFLNPDLSIVYPDKKSLKKSETPYLWPIISSIAAIVVILFLVMNPTSTSLEGIKNTAALPGKPLVKNKRIIESKEIDHPIQKETKRRIKSKTNISTFLLSEEKNETIAQIDINSFNTLFVQSQVCLEEYTKFDYIFICSYNEIELEKVYAQYIIDKKKISLEDFKFVAKNCIGSKEIFIVAANKKDPLEYIREKHE